MAHLSTVRGVGRPHHRPLGPDPEGAGLAEPRAFGRMLKAFPRLTLVLAHMGGATWEQVLEIADTYPNAFSTAVKSSNGQTPPTRRITLRNGGW